MKVSIMQPYFFPYIGYFQLINSSDLFIVYDNIKYTKSGWINRNFLLKNGSSSLFTIPLKKDSSLLDIRERYISKVYNKKHFMRSLEASYSKAPYFKNTYKLVEEIILHREDNLFYFLYNSINKIMNYLDIKTNIVISSDVEIDHSLTSQSKVISMCKNVGATTYINPIGGMSLYCKDAFINESIMLKFIEPSVLPYKQFSHKFVPNLSILDVLMFNSCRDVRLMLKGCKYI